MVNVAANALLFLVTVPLTHCGCHAMMNPWDEKACLYCQFAHVQSVLLLHMSIFPKHHGYRASFFLLSQQYCPHLSFACFVCVCPCACVSVRAYMCVCMCVCTPHEFCLYSFLYFLSLCTATLFFFFLPVLVPQQFLQ